jgi:hypothetical protein
VRFVVVALVLAACHHDKELPPQSATALEGFRYGWQGFNHRVSHLQVQMGASASQVAVIGGTSTTNQFLPDLPTGCEQSSCNEFPAPDTADVEVSWANLTSTHTALATGSVHLEVGRDGGTGTVSVDLPEGAPETATAVISGLRLSTAHPLSGGDACYHPEYGWQPREIAISLGDVSSDGAYASVDVTGAFAAGKTFDPARQCIDDVNDQAIVDLDVDVLFLVGDGQVADQDVLQAAQFPFTGDKLNPDPQADPTPLPLDFGFAPTAVGFAKLDFAFDPDRTDDHGAYLRTLSFTLAPKEAPLPVTDANATATNYSPGTQLTDFGYRFTGVARAVDFDVTAKRGTSTASLPAKLDADGAPVVTAVPH